MHRTHDELRTKMIRARHAMNEGLWKHASAALERIVRECRLRGNGHAEALWALAVCRDALRNTTGAFDALDASIQLDPTALTPHETRDELVAQLQDCAADPNAPATDRRAAANLLARRNRSASAPARKSRSRRP